MRLSIVSITAIWLAMSGLLASCEDGSPGKEWVIAHEAVPQHPFLAPNGRSNMHNDAYMTDTYEIDGPSGVNPEVDMISYADDVNTCVTLAFDSQDRIFTTSAAMLEYKILLLDPQSLQVLPSWH